MPGDNTSASPGTLPNRLLSKRKAAELFGVCERTIDNERRRGKLRTVKIGSRVLFDPQEIARYVEQQTATAPPICDTEG